MNSGQMCFLDISGNRWKAVKGFYIEIVFIGFGLWKLIDSGENFDSEQIDPDSRPGQCHALYNRATKV